MVIYSILFLIVLVACSLVGLFSASSELKNLEKGKVKTRFLQVDARFKSEEELACLIYNDFRRITRRYGQFKIGKTGDPDRRQAEYTRYDTMFLMCSSKNPELINLFEDQFIQAFIKHPNNRNKNAGSGGKSTRSQGRYYLYVVVKH